jgi:membrane associated rhomboid family serine protease
MFNKQKKLVMCQSCRALVEASANECPMCGRESVPALKSRASAAAGSAYFISFVILTINVLLFVLMAVVEVNNGRGADAFIQSASSPVLYDFGALHPAAVAEGQWWRLVTFNFLHIGLMHLIFNSSALYQIGPQVEELFGSQKFIFIYMATGVFSAAASYVFNIAGAGASGAIFGLIGLMAVYGYRQGGSYGKAIMKQMLIWAAIGFMFGAMMGANNVAHAGGFVAGAGLGYLIAPNAPESARSASIWNILAVVCVLALASSFALAGKNYGVLQAQVREYERDRQQDEVRRRQGQDVIRLWEHMRDAEKAWEESNAPGSSKQAPQEIAETLKGVASGVESVPQIDDRSNEIRKRLVDLLNKRASVLGNAASVSGKNNSRVLLASTGEIQEADNIFKSYLEWEDSVLEKYGLVRSEKQSSEK